MPFQASLDGLGRDGRFEGWVRPVRGQVPCQVAFYWNDECIARAIADHFRRDLLQAGRGHGHYGFLARALVDLPPGQCSLTLQAQEGTGLPMTLGEYQIDVPKVKQKKRFFKVEDLIQSSPSWTINDVRQHISSLNLGRSLSDMGPRRFIDVSHRFVFNTWADPGVIRHLEPALVSQELSPEDLLLLMFNRNDQRPGTDSLPSPYDARYPFRHA